MERTREFVRIAEADRTMCRDIIRTLTQISIRDQETGGHITRIGHYAGIIARGLGLGEEYAERSPWRPPCMTSARSGFPTTYC